MRVAPHVEEKEGGVPEGPILALFALLTIVATAFVLWREEANAVDDPAQKALRGEVTGLTKHSLLRSGNLARAIRALRDEGDPGVGVVTFRVAPERVDATVRDREGDEEILRVDPGMGVKTDGLGEGTTRPTVPLTRIRVDAPERVVRAVTRRRRLGATDVDYVTLTISPADGSAAWLLFLGTGRPELRGYMAAPDGTDVRQIGQPSAAQREQTRRQRRADAREQRAHARYLRCLNRASDAEAAARCRR